MIKAILKPKAESRMQTPTKIQVDKRRRELQLEIENTMKRLRELEKEEAAQVAKLDTLVNIKNVFNEFFGNE